MLTVLHIQVSSYPTFVPPEDTSDFLIHKGVKKSISQIWQSRRGETEAQAAWRKVSHNIHLVPSMY